MEENYAPEVESKTPKSSYMPSGEGIIRIPRSRESIGISIDGPAYPYGRAVPNIRVITIPEEKLWQRWILRCLDISISLALLAVFSPIVLVIAILIRADSKGPVIFRQDRVGENNQVFKFYKFRTMYVNASQLFPELYTYDYSEKDIQTMCFKMADDPRLTRVGRILRKISVDELPNLINVIKGNMSLVGPRPEIPQMLKYYQSWQRVKFAVRPGVTGLAQTKGRGLLTFQETISWDLRCVKERSLASYLMILIRTLWVACKGIGAF